MAKQVELSDWQAISRLDMQFHTSFVEGTKNSRLIRIYDTLAAESRMCILNLAVSYPRVDALVQEHQNILDLLEAGDSEGLQRAISRHMQKAVEDLTAMQQNQADPVEPLAGNPVVPVVISPNQCAAGTFRRRCSRHRPE